MPSANEAKDQDRSERSKKHKHKDKREKSKGEEKSSSERERERKHSHKSDHASNKEERRHHHHRRSTSGSADDPPSQRKKKDKPESDVGSAAAAPDKITTASQQHRDRHDHKKSRRSGRRNSKSRRDLSTKSTAEEVDHSFPESSATTATSPPPPPPVPPSKPTNSGVNFATRAQELDPVVSGPALEAILAERSQEDATQEQQRRMLPKTIRVRKQATGVSTDLKTKLESMGIHLLPKPRSLERCIYVDPLDPATAQDQQALERVADVVKNHEEYMTYSFEAADHQYMMCMTIGDLWRWMRVHLEQTTGLGLHEPLEDLDGGWRPHLRIVHPCYQFDPNNFPEYLTADEVYGIDEWYHSVTKLRTWLFGTTASSAELQAAKTAVAEATGGLGRVQEEFFAYSAMALPNKTAVERHRPWLERFFRMPSFNFNVSNWFSLQNIRFVAWLARMTQGVAVLVGLGAIAAIRRTHANQYSAQAFLGTVAAGGMSGAPAFESDIMSHLYSKEWDNLVQIGMQLFTSYCISLVVDVFRSGNLLWVVEKLSPRLASLLRRAFAALEPFVPYVGLAATWLAVYTGALSLGNPYHRFLLTVSLQVLNAISGHFVISLPLAWIPRLRDLSGPSELRTFLMTDVMWFMLQNLNPRILCQALDVVLRQLASEGFRDTWLRRCVRLTSALETVQQAWNVGQLVATAATAVTTTFGVVSDYTWTSRMPDYLNTKRPTGWAAFNRRFREHKSGWVLFAKEATHEALSYQWENGSSNAFSPEQVVNMRLTMEQLGIPVTEDMAREMQQWTVSGTDAATLAKSLQAIGRDVAQNQNQTIDDRWHMLARIWFPIRIKTNLEGTTNVLYLYDPDAYATCEFGADKSENNTCIVRRAPNTMPTTPKPLTTNAEAKGSVAVVSTTQDTRPFWEWAWTGVKGLIVDPDKADKAKRAEIKTVLSHTHVRVPKALEAVKSDNEKARSESQTLLRTILDERFQKGVGAINASLWPEVQTILEQEQSNMKAMIESLSQRIRSAKKMGELKALIDDVLRAQGHVNKVKKLDMAYSAEFVSRKGDVHMHPDLAASDEARAKVQEHMATGAKFHKMKVVHDMEESLLSCVSTFVKRLSDNGAFTGGKSSLDERQATVALLQLVLGFYDGKTLAEFSSVSGDVSNQLIKDMTQYISQTMAPTTTRKPSAAVVQAAAAAAAPAPDKKTPKKASADTTSSSSSSSSAAALGKQATAPPATAASGKQATAPPATTASDKQTAAAPAATLPTVKATPSGKQTTAPMSSHLPTTVKSSQQTATTAPSPSPPAGFMERAMASVKKLVQQVTGESAARPPPPPRKTRRRTDDQALKKFGAESKKAFGTIRKNPKPPPTAVAKPKSVSTPQPTKLAMPRLDSSTYSPPLTTKITEDGNAGLNKNSSTFVQPTGQGRDELGAVQDAAMSGLCAATGVSELDQNRLQSTSKQLAAVLSSALTLPGQLIDPSSRIQEQMDKSLLVLYPSGTPLTANQVTQDLELIAGGGSTDPDRFGHLLREAHPRFRLLSMPALQRWGEAMSNKWRTWIAHQYTSSDQVDAAKAFDQSDTVTELRASNGLAWFATLFDFSRQWTKSVHSATQRMAQSKKTPAADRTTSSQRGASDFDETFLLDHMRPVLERIDIWVHPLDENPFLFMPTTTFPWPGPQPGFESRT